jgi:hypothetical protein
VVREKAKRTRAIPGAAAVKWRWPIIRGWQNSTAVVDSQTNWIFIYLLSRKTSGARLREGGGGSGMRLKAAVNHGR